MTTTEDRALGALLGTMVGDALGMPVENWSARRIARTFGTLDHFRPASLFVQGYALSYGALKDPAHVARGLPLRRGTYTDDTQMLLGVAESLAASSGFDGADMARRFVANFDPRRGYGPGTMRAIGALRRGVPWNEVGEKLFGGTGSFGNGAAMRVAPVAVLYASDPRMLRSAAEQSARITHAHPLGVEGAVVQAHAIALALRSDPAGFDARTFLAELRSSAGPLSEVFERKLDAIARLLDRSPEVEEVVGALGNNTTAQGSVPAALYAVLSHPASFKAAVVYSVSLGGDTDTIGAMAGAIAGALHGAAGIPAEWLEGLENGARGRDYAAGLARDLWRRAG